MRYMLIHHVLPDDDAGSGNPGAGADAPAWSAYTAALSEAGILAGGNALYPTFTATTVRIRQGAADLHDGPYSETKEQVGGYYLIDVPDRETALAWAARNPAAALGAVEVRRVVES